MVDINELLKMGRNENDNSFAQLMLFNEFIKMGAVQFDLNDKLHVQTLIAMIGKVHKLENKDTSHMSEYERIAFKCKLRIYEQIVVNIFIRSLPTLNKDRDA